MVISRNLTIDVDHLGHVLLG